MGALYSGTAISGYNSNPPPDDGTTGANNQVTWNGTIKAKIGDPLNNGLVAMSAALVTAMAKTLSGGSVVSTAVDYPCSAADQGRNIVVTVSGKTVTTPDATSVLTPFVFAVNNQSSGNITVAGFGGTQNVDGAATARLGKGRGIILWTDGANWFTSGLVMGNLPVANPPFGFDAPINLQLNASVGSSLLTIAVKANDGTDPTTSNPVLIPFRDSTGSTLTSGAPVWVAVTSALSINTNAAGATLATQNNVPFRLWVVAFNNAGTAVLALWHSGAGASSPGIKPLNEATLQSTTAISAAATSAGVFYTPNGTTLSTKAFRIIGYVDYVSGLATAGTYSAAPDVVQLFGPGIKKPGDVVQTAYQTTASVTTGSGVTKTQTASTVAISPTSAANLVRVQAFGNTHNSGSAAFTQISRGAAPTLIGNQTITNGSSSNDSPTAMFALDAPGTTSATSYFVYIWGTAGFNGTWNSGVGVTSSMSADEIMG